VYIKENSKSTMEMSLNSSPIKGRNENVAADKPKRDIIDSPQLVHPVATSAKIVPPPTETLTF